MTLSYLSAEAASLEPVLGNVRGNDFVNIDADFEVCELLTDGEIVHSIRATPQEALDAVHTLPSVTCLLRFLVCPFPSLSLASLEKGTEGSLCRRACFRQRGLRNKQWDHVKLFLKGIILEKRFW